MKELDGQGKKVVEAVARRLQKQFEEWRKTYNGDAAFGEGLILGVEDQALKNYVAKVEIEVRKPWNIHLVLFFSASSARFNGLKYPELPLRWPFI